MRKIITIAIAIIILVICLITMGVVSFATLTKENMNVEDSAYVACEINELFNEVKKNPLNARDMYEDSYVKFYGKITDIHNYGYYIYVSDNNSEWDYDTIRCVVMNKEQEKVLKTKSIGDVILIKGRITLIGENVGFNVNIHGIE